MEDRLWLKKVPGKRVQAVYIWAGWYQMSCIHVCLTIHIAVETASSAIIWLPYTANIGFLKLMTNRSHSIPKKSVPGGRIEVISGLLLYPMLLDLLFVSCCDINFELLFAQTKWTLLSTIFIALFLRSVDCIMALYVRLVLSHIGTKTQSDFYFSLIFNVSKHSNSYFAGRLAAHFWQVEGKVFLTPIIRKLFLARLFTCSVFWWKLFLWLLDQKNLTTRLYQWKICNKKFVQ